MGSTLSLTSALDGLGAHLHDLAALLPEGADSHFIGGSVSPRVGMEACGKTRFHRDSIPTPSSR